MAVTINDITSNVTVDNNFEVTGDGIFDDIMETINKHIVAQFNAKRINNTDIAKLYIGIIPSVLAESIKLALQKDITGKNLEVLQAQKELYERQKQSFDDNKYQKMFEAQINYNSMIFQDDPEPVIPDAVKNSPIADVYNKIVSDAPISVTVDE